MIAHAHSLPGSNWTHRDLLGETRSARLILRAPIRCYSGRDCGSCGRPIDRDGVCRCSF